MAHTWTDADRDRWGRPLVIPPGGGKATGYTRATTIAKTLDDGTALKKWAMRGVALGIAERRDLRAEAANSRDDKDALNRIAEEALNAAGGKERRELGSQIHGWTDQVDNGEQPWGIDNEGQADLDAYVTATADIDWKYVEQSVVCDELKVGGTPDRIGTYKGRLVIADLKTGGTDVSAFMRYSALSIAMQLAIYSRSLGYNVATGERFPLGDIDQNNGLVIHLVPGTAQVNLVWVDLRAGWEAAQHATAVREWRKRKDLWVGA